VIAVLQKHLVARKHNKPIKRENLQLAVFAPLNNFSQLINFPLLGRYNSKDRYEQSESNKNSKTSKVNY
jgi:hypothetical protein